MIQPHTYRRTALSIATRFTTIALVAVMALLVSSVAAGEAPRATSVDKALELAAQKQTNVLIDFYTDW